MGRIERPWIKGMRRRGQPSETWKEGIKKGMLDCRVTKSMVMIGPTDGILAYDDDQL